MKSLTWVDAALGVWIMAGPVALGYSLFNMSIAENLVPGLLLVVTSGLMLAGRLNRLWGDWVQELCGLWLIIGSVAWFAVHGWQAALNSLIVGLLVLGIDVADTLRATRRPDAIA